MRDVLKNLCQYPSHVCAGLVPPRFNVFIFKRENSPGWFVGRRRLRVSFSISKDDVLLPEQSTRSPEVLNLRATERTVRHVCASASSCHLHYFKAGNFCRLVCGSSALHRWGGWGVVRCSCRMIVVPNATRFGMNRDRVVQCVRPALTGHVQDGESVSSF